VPATRATEPGSGTALRRSRTSIIERGRSRGQGEMAEFSTRTGIIAQSPATKGKGCCREQEQDRPADPKEPLTSADGLTGKHKVFPLRQEHRLDEAGALPTRISHADYAGLARPPGAGELTVRRERGTLKYPDWVSPSTALTHPACRVRSVRHNRARRCTGSERVRCWQRFEEIFPRRRFGWPGGGGCDTEPIRSH